TPGGKPIHHERHVLVAQLLQRMPCQGSPSIAASMQENVSALVGHNVIDANFQEPTRQQPGLGDMSLIVLFFLPYVQDDKLLASLELRMYLVSGEGRDSRLGGRHHSFQRSCHTQVLLTAQ